MNVCFIIPTEVASIGCRLLSSYLREHGHATRLIFIPNLIPAERNSRKVRDVKFECSNRLKQLVLELVQDCDLIGFSVLAQFYEPLAELSSFLKAHLDCPIVWGGIHATMDPESCLPYADIVSIGDGEETLLDLIRALQHDEDLKDVAGITFRQDGRTICTEFRELERNIDRCPALDFSFHEHFWVSAQPGQEQVREITPAIYHEVQNAYPRDAAGKTLLVPYKTIATRGCPYTCSYCSIGSQDKKRFPFRQRSVANLIAELVQVIRLYGDIIEVISFSDDTFLILSEQWLTDFCAQYKQKINYPFRVIGHPLNVSTKKIEMLAQAGCIHFGMGIESLSEKVLYTCYNRKTPVDKVIDAANVLVDISRQYGLHPPTFDVILGNPYENSLDVLETLRHLTRIASPAQYVRYSLCLFPGSDLYEKAVQDGLIDARDPSLYRSWYTNTPDVAPYLNLLHKFITKEKYQFPRWYQRFLSTPAVFKCFQFCFREHHALYKRFFDLSAKLFSSRR